MKFDRAACRDLSAEITAVLKAHFADRPDITIAVGGGTYSPFEFKPKLVLTTTSDDGMTKEKADFLAFAELFNLKPEDYGREFTANGTAFRLTGIVPNRPKFPFLARNVQTGKEFKFTASLLTKFGVEIPDFLKA